MKKTVNLVCVFYSIIFLSITATGQSNITFLHTIDVPDSTINISLSDSPEPFLTNIGNSKCFTGAGITTTNFIIFDKESKELSIFNLSTSLNTIQSKLWPQLATAQSPTKTYFTVTYSGKTSINPPTEQFIFVFDSTLTNISAKKTDPAPFQSLFLPAVSEFMNDSVLLISHYATINSPSGDQQNATGLIAWNFISDSILWRKIYYPELPNSSCYPSDIQTTENSIVFGGFLKQSTSHLKSFILRISKETGEIMHSAIIPHGTHNPLARNLNFQKDTDGNLYIGGLFKQYGSANSYFNFIAKIDKEWKIIWARKALITNFDPIVFGIKSDPEGNLIFVTYTFKQIPAVIGKLDWKGDLLWYKGFEFYHPSLLFEEDQSLFIFSSKRYDESGEISWPGVIAKTDKNGKIQDCPQFNSCMIVDTFNLPFQFINWNSIDTGQLFDINYTLEPLGTYSTYPYCSNLQPPNPFFSLPDTVCAGTCLQPDSTFNRLAHHVEWRISGPM
ncbi:hypothetical protein D6779_08300, partial [Candidatus Parcubacteria bacterium]